MRKTGNGRIVAIGSRAALEPGAGVGAYSASKAAMVSLIRTVALENKDAGITANVILPGTMDTPANRKFMPNADVLQMGSPRCDREPDHVAGRRCGQRRQWRGDPGIWQRYLKFVSVHLGPDMPRCT